MTRDDTYTLTVTFFRSFGDDANVVGKDAPTDSEFVQQLRKELQMAYDHADIAMAGGFDISGIDTKSARAEPA
jgi:hypothetical protein